MLRSRLLLALALVTLNACAMTFDGSKLGVPVTMGSKAGAPAKGQPFKVSSGSIWVLWGAVPVKKPSIREPLGSQLVGGQSLEDVKITVGSRWYDVLVSVITLGPGHTADRDAGGSGGGRPQRQPARCRLHASPGRSRCGRGTGAGHHPDGAERSHLASV